MYDLGIEAKRFDRTQASKDLRVELCIPDQNGHAYCVPMTRGRDKRALLYFIVLSFFEHKGFKCTVYQSGNSNASSLIGVSFCSTHGQAPRYSRSRTPVILFSFFGKCYIPSIRYISTLKICAR